MLTLEGFSRVEREHRYRRGTRAFKAGEIVTIATEIVDKLLSVVEYSHIRGIFNV